MGLKLIYGKSGTGKSQYCFTEIKELIKSSSKIYMITPEQFSFTAEKKLLDIVETNSIVQAEILTFKRMAERILTEVGGAAKVHLSDCGRTMLIYHILQDTRKKLTFLTNPERNVEVALNAITELKKHMVSIEQLEQLEIENPYLEAKLQDIKKIYAGFQEKIINQYIDENDILSLLINQLPKSNMFHNSIIYIDEFVGFTEQEYGVIKQLLKIAKQVNITICTDKLEKSQKQVEDVFYTSKKTVEKLIHCVNEVEASLEEPIYLTTVYRFENQELVHLENNISSVRVYPYQEKTPNINLFLALNPYSEIEQVAKQIIKLVRDNHYEYKDIAIISKNMDNYSSMTKAIFSEYRIPVFIDEKKDMNQNILAQYILAILDIFVKGWSYETVFNYLKNILVGLEKDIVYRLENYCLKWGIKGTAWYQGCWEYEDTYTQELEKVRKWIVEPLLNLKEKMKQQKDVTSFTKEIYYFLVQQNMEMKMEEKANILETIGVLDVANEYRSSFSAMISVFDEIVLLFGSNKISFEKYRELLKMGLKNISIGAIPASLDQVIMGDVDRSRSHKVKAVFIIGLNDGIFPSAKKEEGFLNDKDRDMLKEVGIQLASGTLEKLYEEQYNIYKTFSIAEEKLFLSYSSSDKDGKSLRPSSLIMKIKKIFPCLIMESDIVESVSNITIADSTLGELLHQLYRLKNGENIDKIWYHVLNWYQNNDVWKLKLKQALIGLQYSNLAENLTTENVMQLYGNTLKTSISKLEQYKKCPFSFYLKYALNLKEQEEFRIKPIDTGSFMHDVIDTFFEKAENIKILETVEIKNIVDSIVEEKLALPRNYIFTSTPKFKVLTKKLKDVILQSLEYILYQLNNSSFEIKGNEVEFKRGGEYPPIVLELENNQKVEIIGKIDRIDVGKNGNNQYVRIIDYKSSVKNIDLNEVVNGLQIQLLTYMDSVTDKEKLMPAGAFYYNLLDPIIKNTRNLTEEEIKQEVKKKFKLQGFILADVTVIKMMDHKLEKGNSDIVPASIKADGTVNTNAPGVITAEEFQKLQKHIRRLVKQIAKEILKGKVEIKPYRDKTKKHCDYCEYKSICGFDTGIEGNEYWHLNQKKKQEILSEL